MYVCMYVCVNLCVCVCMCVGVCIRGCIRNFTSLCHWVQLYRYFVSQSSEFGHHNLLCCFSTSNSKGRRIFHYDSVRKLVDTPSYVFIYVCMYVCMYVCIMNVCVVRLLEAPFMQQIPNEVLLFIYE
jgi:hypothetical protein